MIRSIYEKTSQYDLLTITLRINSKVVEPEIQPIPELLGEIGIGAPMLNCIGRCGGACPPCE